MKRILLVLLLIVTVINVSATPDIRAFKDKVKDGYNFMLYTPQGAGDTTAKPLIIFLHGASLCGNNLERVKRYGPLHAISMGRSIDAYVVAPQNPGGSWNPRKVMNVVDYVEKECKIDTTRVYVIGMSLGGYGTTDVTATYPDRIAAAVSICGGATVKDYSGLVKVPMWIIHGTGDRAVSVTENDRVVEAVNKAREEGDSVRLTYDRINGMDHSRPARLLYSSQIYDWLMSHSLTDTNRAAKPTFELTEQVFNNAYQGLTSQARRSRRRHSRR